MADEVGLVANRYQILARLAVGGMAEIYLARGAGAAGVERYCVLKRVLRSRANDAHVVRMFLDEARLGAQLQHPNIASVYDIGSFADSYFFTMEYVHGETVRTMIHRAQALGRTLPLSCVLTIIAGAAAGLHHAHDRTAADGRPLGIVHRDVSPSNLMVGYEGHVKVVDFGVAKAANREETETGTIKGKIGYLSPEQSRGEAVDRRSDLFALGIVMWEMLTGARLYQRASDFATMTAIVHELPPPPSAYRPELPAEIDALVLRLLAKRVTDRFQDAAQLVEAIEDAALRTATALSGTAVRRLAGELFGARLEPWLELDRVPPRHRAITLATRALPVASDVPVEPTLEADLASVPDLGPARGAGEPTASASLSEVRHTPAPRHPAIGSRSTLAADAPAPEAAVTLTCTRDIAPAPRITEPAPRIADPAPPPTASMPRSRGALPRAALAMAAVLAAAWLTEHAVRAPAATSSSPARPLVIVAPTPATPLVLAAPEASELAPPPSAPDRPPPLPPPAPRTARRSPPAAPIQHAPSPSAAARGAPTHRPSAPALVIVSDLVTPAILQATPASDPATGLVPAPAVQPTYAAILDATRAPIR